MYAEQSGSGDDGCWERDVNQLRGKQIVRHRL